MRVCACYVIWLCGVCFVCCCRPSGALGLLGLTEPHTGTSSAPAVPPASARCPLPPWYAWTAGLPVELDRCVGIRRSSRLRWTGARPLLAASRPLPPETSPISAGTRTWTPQEYDASAPSPSQDTTSRSPPRPAVSPACRRHRRSISAAADGRLLHRAECSRQLSVLCVRPGSPLRGRSMCLCVPRRCVRECCVVWGPVCAAPDL